VTTNAVTGDVVTGTTDPEESSGGGSGSSSGGRDACADLDREACTEMEACTPILCGLYEMTQDGTTPWCLAGPEFIGCRSADINCPAVRAVTCEGDDAPIYVCPDGCTPDGFMECDPPVNGDVPACRR
jgi:hypothetical protein